MAPLPDTAFDDWTLDQVAAATDGEPVGEMPGSRRRLPGPRRKLLEAMQAAGVRVAGDLDALQRDHFTFSLTTWPYGDDRGRDYV
jgi:hypothetical protein